MEHRKNVTEIKIGIKWHSTSSYRDETWEIREFHDFDGIQEAIEKAQECILNAAGREVAPDIVEISVHSPDTVDLTLIDLPGLVRSVGKGESESLVSDIASLISEFLQNERCIILAVVPANVDFHNSQIMADAIKVDPRTCRTIPVITKPDLIDAGAENAVKELLLGNKKDFRMGFHMTKCRGQKALNEGMNLTEGIDQERIYFTTTSPWKDIDDRGLFGVESLREKLAALQVRMIEESVPTIMKEVGRKKALALEELDKLGKDLSTDALRRECYTRFMDSAVRFVTDTAAGRGSFKMKDGFTWRSKLENVYTDFASDILKQKIADMGCLKAGQAVYVVDSKGNEVRGIICQIGNKENSDLVYVDPMDDTQNLSIFFEQVAERTWEGHEGVKVDEKKKYAKTGNPCIVRSAATQPSASQFGAAPVSFGAGTAPAPAFGGFGGGSGGGFGSTTPAAPQVAPGIKVTVQDYKPFPLDTVYPCHSWLQDRLSRSRTEHLSCFLNPTVFNSVIADMMQSDVEPLCLGLLDACHALLSTLIDAVPQADPYGQCAKLQALFQKRAGSVIADLHSSAQRRLRERLDVEQLPFTSNHYLYEMISKKRNERLKRRLLKSTAGMTDPAAVAAAITALFGENERRSCEEHVAMEMQLALEAYGKLASKRIIDDVPMLITAAMITPLADGLRGSMCPTDAELRVQLKEVPEAAARRLRAAEQLRAMEAAEAAFDALLTRQFGWPGHGK
jgi:hypothetical protein